MPNTNERSSIERYDEIVTGFVRTKCDIIIGSDLNFDFNKVNNNRNTSDIIDVFFTAWCATNCETSHSYYSYKCYDQ